MVLDGFSYSGNEASLGSFLILKLRRPSDLSAFTMVRPARRQQMKKYCENVDLNKNSFMNPNYEEERNFVENLARDYVLHRVYGKEECICGISRTMRKRGLEMENKHSMFFDHVCRRLYINEQNVEQVFKKVLEEVLGKEVNWGRLVSVFAFSGKVAQMLKEKSNSDEKINNIIICLTECVMKNIQWIIENGGWVSYTFLPSHIQ